MESPQGEKKRIYKSSNGKGKEILKFLSLIILYKETGGCERGD